MRLFTQLTTLVFFLLSFSMHAQDSYNLTIESNVSTVTTGTTYRFYVDMLDPTDRVSAVFGHNLLPLTISAPAGVFNTVYNGSWSASGLNAAFLTTFPEMTADSYATIGLEGPAGSSGLDGAADPSLVEDVAQPLSPFFTDNGSTTVEINTIVGSAVYVLNTASNGLTDENMRVLIMQITTAGSLSGTLNYQVFPFGIGADAIDVTSSFSEGGGEVVGCMISMACNFDPLATIACDDCCDFTSCLSIGCMNELACNYDPEATIPDGSCTFANAPYDCDGECVNDADGDGICDVFETYGCTDVTACNYNDTASEDDGNCTYALAPYDCDWNCLLDIDGDGTCDQDEVAGCTNANACNYNSYAIIDNGSCEFLSCIVFDCADTTACNYNPDTDFDDGSCVYANYPYDCNGECVEDNDGDGICDSIGIEGCTDTAAVNFNPFATDDNDSCIILVGGCVIPFACNYNPDADFYDPGSCDFNFPCYE